MDKTELVIFGTAKRLSNNADIDINISINGQLILRKKVVKYLGIFFNCTLSWKDHVSFVLKKREKELVC
jgi:hypothetical protein